MSKTIARILAGAARGATAWQRPARRANTLLNLSGLLTGRHTVDTKHGPIAFVSTHPQALDQALSLLSREPGTIEWLDRLDENAVFWDIGANIGIYSLYAARRGARVYAFEPAPASFAALSENIRVNRLDDRVAALPVAFGGRSSLGTLAMQQTNPGSVQHSVGERTAGEPFKQAALVYTVDEWRRGFGIAAPTHIKLDADGVEPDIVEGARETLADPGLRSLLVEVAVDDRQTMDRIQAVADTAGLTLADPGMPDGYGTRNARFDRIG